MHRMSRRHVIGSGKTAERACMGSMQTDRTFFISAFLYATIHSFWLPA